MIAQPVPLTQEMPGEVRMRCSDLYFVAVPYAQSTGYLAEGTRLEKANVRSMLNFVNCCHQDS